VSNEVARKNEDQLAELGDSQVWIKRTPTGQIRSVRAIINLREDQGELVKVEGQLTISAKGYYRANQIASLAILTPDSIKVPAPNGMGTIDVANPYPIIDPESGTQKGVWVKKIAVGYSPIGSIAVSSTTMFYDFGIYFLEDLQKKIRYNKAAGRFCFRDQLSEEEKKTGMFTPIEGQFGVWANTNHEEVLKAIGTWVQTKKFGERKAQTVAERNVLKHHPALALQMMRIQGGDGSKVAQVAVIGWQHDHDAKELERIALAADAGEEVRIDGMVVEAIDASDQVDEIEVQASIEGEPEDIRSELEEQREGLF
jgi:hypothetical protein